MRITILDGYTDEPACLGVPPYISPHPRYVYGAIKGAGYDATYMTIDEYRAESVKCKTLQSSALVVIIAGAIVPGKYIRATPISSREVLEIARNLNSVKILGGAAARFGFGGIGGRKAKALDEINDYFDHVCSGDLDACVFNYLDSGKFSNRTRTDTEWKDWPVSGAEIVMQHPDFPRPLIAEIETYRGCVRYKSKGCSFCIEPAYGKPSFRDEDDITLEAKALSDRGVVNFRLGAQSCIFSYKGKGIGDTETPVPNPEAIWKLLSGIKKAIPQLEVLHTDNANPAVIAEHPVESEEIVKLICMHCTSGNAVAFGMESADPIVIKENNLNATPWQVMKAIELINRYGAIRGKNGMPLFLPGINFVYGLNGETKETYELNLQFLRNVLEKGLLLRRINIRQALAIKQEFNTRKYHSIFMKYKRRTREEIDREILKRLVPLGTILRNVYIEGTIQGLTYGRQVGTYPILIGIPYHIESGKIIDITITDHGYRSITGIEYPFDINKANFSALESLPFIGRKRAARIKIRRPFKNGDELKAALDDNDVATKLLPFIRF